jgi:hypothetical protein
MPGEGTGVEFPGGLTLHWEASESGAPTWHLHGEIDWSAYESLQVVSAAVEGDTLALAALRPAGAKGHDADLLAAGFTRAGEEEPAGIEQALMSVEHGPDGSMRRIGVELWLGGGVGLRIAADRGSESEISAESGVRRESTPLRVRMDGREGEGVHDLLSAA